MNLRRLALFVLYLFIPLFVYAQPFPEAVELLRHSWRIARTNSFALPRW